MKESNTGIKFLIGLMVFCLLFLSAAIVYEYYPKSTATNANIPAESLEETLSEQSVILDSSIESVPSSEAPTRDNSTAKLTKLFTGTFYTGPDEDIPAGRYVFTCKGSGNFMIKSSNDTLLINEILTDDATSTLGVTSVTCDISEGDSIEISGIESVSCKPATTAIKTTLSAGYWVVGLDSPSGTYDVTGKDGESGNFIVYSNSSTSTNEILGGDYGVKTIRVEFNDGDIIYISGMSRVNLKIVQ